MIPIPLKVPYNQAIKLGCVYGPQASQASVRQDPDPTLVSKPNAIDKDESNRLNVSGFIHPQRILAGLAEHPPRPGRFSVMMLG